MNCTHLFFGGKLMDSIAKWMGSCSFEEPHFQEPDELCRQRIDPYFQLPDPSTLEQLITTTLKLYKEVVFIRDTVLGDRLHVNYVSRKQFAENVMMAWAEKHSRDASIVRAICYDLSWG
jgi:hypothetical protein